MTKTRLSAIVLILILVISLVGAVLSVTILSTKESKPNVADSTITGDSASIRTNSTPTELPTFNPSSAPSGMQILSKQTSLPASEQPSPAPTQLQPFYPSNPSGCRHATRSILGCKYATFYAIADVPYTDIERAELPGQILAIPDNADFLIHLGDIRSARDGEECPLDDYRSFADILKLSRVPVFVVMGDNEYNDCKNFDNARGYWSDELGSFENNWVHNFNVTRPRDYPENFAFVHKEVLFIGLNLVGGKVSDQQEWDARLIEQALWTAKLMSAHTGGDLSVEQVTTVVIFGHASPSPSHTLFFSPLAYFLRNELAHNVSVLYMNGNGHFWSYDFPFLGHTQLIRIQLTGGTSEPPLQVIVAPSEDSAEYDIESVFLYDRRL